MIENTKQCTGCNKVLPLTSFNDSPTGKDFKKSWCKACESLYNKQYYSLRKYIMRVNKEQNQQTLSK